MARFLRNLLINLNKIKIMIKNYLLTGLLAIAAISGFAQNPEMVQIEGGSFYMGNDNPVGGVAITDEAPEHKVTVNSFMMSKTEVTFELYDMFCDATGLPKPSDGGYGRGNKPVINVSWEHAVRFCNWLSRREKLDQYYNIKLDTISFKVTINETANGYRLPTEAEWEYAARGGANGQGYIYSGSNDADAVAWWRKNSGNKPHDVGTKKANEVGLFDMTGNAYEWCWDLYDKDYYKKSPENDPKGGDKGNDRVYRGGDWNSNKDYIRLSGRYFKSERGSSGMVGIRLAKNVN